MIDFVPVSDRAPRWPFSPALSPRFLCRLSEYLGRARRCLWLEMMGCNVSFGFGVTHSM